MTKPISRIGSLFILDLGTREPGPRAGRVLTCRSDGSELSTLVDSLEANPDGIVFDPQQNLIYWTNMGASFGRDNDGHILCADLQGHHVRTIVPSGSTHTPKQLTMDHDNRKIYWADREGMRIMRCNMDGSDIEVLVQTGFTDQDRADATNWCVGIAVDTLRGKIYWTQKGPSKGGRGRIFRANFDVPAGETPDRRTDIELLLDHLPEPIDIELGDGGKMLYWSDRGDPPRGNTVNRAYIGHGTEIIEPKVIVRKMHEAIGLTLDHSGGHMYMTDLAGSVYRANLDGSDELVILPDVGDLTGVAFVTLD
ncbi:hypothetical protein MMC13_007588 [Lambiella insularis]|nr:hypothetical protein [Lambiella insularis]